MKKSFRPFWEKTRKLFNLASFSKPELELIEPTKFKGQTIQAQKELDGPLEEVVIESVLGCAAMGLEKEQENRLVKYFQINGSHFCHMLSFYMQLEGDENGVKRLPTKEEIDEIELATQIVAIKELKNGKK